MSALSMAELGQVDAARLRTDKQRQVIAALRQARGDLTEATRILGWHRQRVYDMVFRLRRSGVLPGYRPCPLRKRLETGDLKLGKMDEESRRASPEMCAWLAKEIPPGGNIVSFAFAVFADVMEADLVQRVRALTHRGLTMRQVEDTLIVGEGWPLAAVRSAVEQVRRADPSYSRSSAR